MSKNKYLYNLLNKEYQIFIRNSQNLEEKFIIKFGYIKFILFIIIFVLSSLLVSTVLVRYILGKYLDPTHLETINKDRLKKIYGTLNILEKKVSNQNEFIKTLQQSLNKNTGNTPIPIMTYKGCVHDEAINSFPSSHTLDKETYVKTEKETKLPYNNTYAEDHREIEGHLKCDYKSVINKIDRLQNANKEKEMLFDLKYNNLKDTSFIPPVKGIIISHMDFYSEHYGIDIVAKKDEVVKSIDNGMVIFTGWTIEGGNIIVIQHKKNLITIYKHNSQLLKKAGNFVSKGDAIAIIGNSGDFSTGPHLHFEMWHNGDPINPQDYIIF